MTDIRLEGLTKRFGSTAAVDGIDLTIESGELFFLLGPSGCGKTTLLRMIAGFVVPTAGRIRFGADDVTALSPSKRNTGMVFQSYALWPHMTVADNVGYGLTIRKVDREQRNDRITAALRMVQMEAYAKRKPNELSGGQQQRVALARALVVKPTVLLLDEPLSNLDAKLRLGMRTEIRRICTESGITTVYVTHDQKEALSMADRVAVLKDGQTVQVGTPRDLYERPATRFVADFLGEANFLTAVVAGAEDGAVMLDTPAGTLASTAGLTKSPHGGNITCSIRPEAWRVSTAPGAANTLKGTRRSSVYLGEVAQHLVELSDGSLVKVLELNPSHLGAPDEEMYLTVQSDDVVVLGD